MSPAEFFQRLEAFTREACAALGRPFDAGRRRNHHGRYGQGLPSGHVLHYTASPDTGIGRMRSFMSRFALNSGTRVGVHFGVFDRLSLELDGVREGYPDLFGPDGPLVVDVLHYGLAHAFWASNWANRFTVATEVRNVGGLYPSTRGRFYWGRKKNTGSRKHLHAGRDPVQVRERYWEPFADGQIQAVHAICSNLVKLHGDQFRASHFLGHAHIHRTKWDPLPHFPFGRLKSSLFEGTRFELDGYLEELDGLRCPPVEDRESASAFLSAMGYLPGDPTEATRLYQRKMGLGPTGKLTRKTIAAMNRTRRVYRLHLPGDS